MLFLNNNKEKWDESFSRARATKKKETVARYLVSRRNCFLQVWFAELHLAQEKLNASTAPVLNASIENQYGTSTGLPVLEIVIIPDICQYRTSTVCQHCGRTCQYGRSTPPVVNFLLGNALR